MSGSPIIRIEINDSDLLMRQKCNQNFNQLARNNTSQAQQVELVANSDVVADIILAMNDKVSQSELDQLSSALTEALAAKVNKDNILAGNGIKVTLSGDAVVISTLCPIPVNGIYFHEGTFTPSELGWTDTTWELVEQTVLSAQAWKRLT